MPSPSSDPLSAGVQPTIRELVLVKLGGSLLTDKRRAGHARTDVIRRLAGELAAALPGLRQRGEGLILGHGSGSFGHVAAAKHGLRSGLRDGPVLGAADTQNQAARLHRMLAEALIEAGAPAWSWSPSTALVARAGKPAAGSIDSLVAALGLGLVPVVYGDVLLDRTFGASIASTEAVLAFLIPRLGRGGLPVRRILWLGETDGVYDAEGNTIPRVDQHNRLAVRQ